jgi:hypothetical protein
VGWNLVEPGLPSTLDELAAKGGGKVFTAEDTAELADLLADRSAGHVEHHEDRLWQSWGTPVLFVLLLAAEWVWRRLVGLP